VTARSLLPKNEIDVPRAGAAAESLEYRFGEFVLEPRIFELRRDGEPVEIQRQAFDVLRYLIEHRERVVARDELLDRLWSDRSVTYNALTQSIAAARRAIGDAEGTTIETVYGRGFRFAAPLSVAAAHPAQDPDSASAPPDRSPEEQRAAERAEWARCFAPMLSDLYGQLRPVRLFAATRQSTDADDVSILSLYTALDVALQVGPEPAAPEPGDGAKGHVDLRARLEQALAGDLQQESAAIRSERARKRYRRRVRALEAAAVSPRLVLLGPPGSGKSTFVQHLALCLTGSLLDHAEAHVGRLRERPPEAPAWHPWEQQPWLPVFIELRHFVASEAFPRARAEGGASHVFAYLALRDARGSDQHTRLEQHMQERDGDGVLLILDGLDEIPLRATAGAERDAEGTREQLKRVVRSFVNRFPKARVILTSRPYAYEPGSPWRLDAQGFEEVELAPFSPAQVRSFCTHWYAGMAERRVIGPDQIERRASALAVELESQE
jgi:DNA-binding winged helix-turn-helix (wHTH) protein